MGGGRYILDRFRPIETKKKYIGRRLSTRYALVIPPGVTSTYRGSVFRTVGHLAARGGQDKVEVVNHRWHASLASPERMILTV
jgi:hypothetical protein